MNYKIRFTVTLVFLITLVVFFGAFLGLATAGEEFQPVRGKDLAVPGEYIVAYRGLPFENRATASQRAAAACKNVKLNVVKQAKFAPVLRCRLSAGQNIEQVKAELLKDKHILAVEPNHIAWIPEPQAKARAGAAPASPNIGKILTQTNDPMLLWQWGYFKIQANLTPELPSGTPLVAVIDTGVDYTHPDLKDRVSKGPDFVGGDTDPMDDNSHGTHVAGIIAAVANNGLGITGISPKSKIYAIKVLNSDGWGTEDDIVDGIYAAANNSSVKVINMSLGGLPNDVILQNAVIYAVTTKLKLLVVAAGNSDTDDEEYPAAYSQALAVAASDIDDNKAWYSNYGAWVDIAAPGGDTLNPADGGILSTVPGSIWPLGYDWYDGTSMAAPFVSGAAARLWAANSSLTAASVRASLTANGDTLPGAGWPVGTTFKRLNLYKALGLATISNRAHMSAYFLDSVSGLPLLGAKVQALQGSTVKGVDYVPMDGFAEMVFDPGTNYRFKISKTAYPTITLPPTTEPAMTFIAGDDVFGGVMPVAPNQGTWQLAVAWDDSFYDFDPYLAVPISTAPPAWWIVGIFGDSFGRMNQLPFARWYRDCYDDGIPVEDISVKKNLSGTYYFVLNNWNNDNMQDSDLNLKVLIYKGSTLVKMLYAMDTPGDGTKAWWYIGHMVGSTFYTDNTFQDVPPASAHNTRVWLTPPSKSKPHPDFGDNNKKKSPFAP